MDTFDFEEFEDTNRIKHDSKASVVLNQVRRRDTSDIFTWYLKTFISLSPKDFTTYHHIHVCKSTIFRCMIIIRIVDGSNGLHKIQ